MPTQEDTTYITKIITPNGLIVTVDEGNTPKNVREALHAGNLKLAAESYSKSTGLRVTIEVKTQVTASPENDA